MPSQAPSVTFWGRLEPIIRTPFFDEVYASTITDPLWLLGRQWQLGEFEGNDAGTAIRTDIAYETTTVGTFCPEGQTPITYTQNTILNALVEPEPVQASVQTTEANLRTAVSLGQQFIRLLGTNGVTGSDLSAAKTYYFNNYSPASSSPNDDAATTRFRAIASGQSINGISLFNDIVAGKNPLPPASSGLSAATLQSIGNALTDYEDFFQSVFSLPPSDGTSWTTEQLDYQFDLAATKDSTSSVVLSATDYRGGELDWYTFMMNPSSSLATNLAGTNTITDYKSVVLPSHIEFKGMPNRRWWDFEDSQLNPSSISVDQVGLPTLLLINFIVNQANDWFVMPLQLNVGSLARIMSLTVTDTFGQQTQIQPANSNPIDPDDPWRVFTMSVESGTPDPNWINLLFLPPVSDHILEGDELESVNFLKDEVADMVWGVEDTLQNPAGDPVAGYRGTLPPVAIPTGNTPAYILTTNVPPNWIPFLPQYIAAGSPVVNLQESNMLIPTSGGPQPVQPQGVILQPQVSPPAPPAPYLVREEQVPPEGAVVTRKFRRARWTDGSSQLWIGRKRTIGRGEASSGLRFDAIYDPSTETFE